MRSTLGLDSKFRGFLGQAEQLKGCATLAAGHYCFPQNCGCSSVVEHLLAKEDVASSTLVTRSNPESFRGWSERAPKQCEGGPPRTLSF